MMSVEADKDSGHEALLAIERFIKESRFSNEVEDIELELKNKYTGKECLHIYLNKHIISLSMDRNSVEIEFQFKPTLKSVIQSIFKDLRGEKNIPYLEQNEVLGEGAIDLAHTLKALVSFINSEEGLNKSITIYPSDEKRKKIYSRLVSRIEGAKVNIY